MTRHMITSRILRLGALGVLATGLLALRPAAAAELVMFTSDYCEWCEEWEKDIGVLYHLTDEAKTAPLKRVDETEAGKFKHLDRNIVYTPTFVLFDKDKEVGRIIGYPGEHFFFPMLKNLLGKLQH